MFLQCATVRISLVHSDALKRGTSHFANLERFCKWLFPSKTSAEVIIRVASFYIQLVLLFIQQAHFKFDLCYIFVELFETGILGSSCFSSFGAFKLQMSN